eukprot:13504523-Heterocapsa_arctica.AAC.1
MYTPGFFNIYDIMPQGSKEAYEMEVGGEDKSLRLEAPQETSNGYEIHHKYTVQSIGINMWYTM